MTLKMRESVPSKPSSVASDNSSDDNYQVQEVTRSVNSDDSDSENEMALQNAPNQEVPSFGNVSVMNSTDIHFGNKTIYQGPVTIKQFLYANGNSGEAVNSSQLSALKSSGDIVLDTNGIDNVNFVGENDVTKDNVVKDINALDNNNVPVRKGFYILGKFPHRKLTIISLIVILIVFIVILLAVLLRKHSSPKTIVSTDGKEESDVLRIPPYDLDQNLTLSSKLRMISRVEWVAQPAIESPTPLNNPVPLVIIHHTATENCTSIGQCVLQVRLLQEFHIQSRQWWDIGYNFLVGGDGSAYEGRGWKAEGAHLRGYNSKSIGIAFIGTFMKYKPPKIQIDACKKLILMGVEEGYVSKDYKVLAARQLLTTESPGILLYEDIKSWPHWSQTP